MGPFAQIRVPLERESPQLGKLPDSFEEFATFHREESDIFVRYSILQGGGWRFEPPKPEEMAPVGACLHANRRSVRHLPEARLRRVRGQGPLPQGQGRHL